MAILSENFFAPSENDKNVTPSRLYKLSFIEFETTSGENETAVINSFDFFKYPCERNKGLSSTFQPPEEGRSVQRPKSCDKHSDKDENNSSKNVNNVYNTSSQKY